MTTEKVWWQKQTLESFAECAILALGKAFLC
jgi:hypothetical protein